MAVIYNQSAISGGSAVPILTNNWYGGRFTVGDTYALAFVDIYAYRVGNPGALTVSIYPCTKIATNGPVPENGAIPIASTVIPEASIGVSPFAWYRDFAIVGTLVPGTVYGITYECDGGPYPTNYYYVYTRSSDPTEGLISYTSGATWSWFNRQPAVVLYSSDLPLKATTPGPSDGDAVADFLDYTLSWVDGGGSDTFDVYIGDSAGTLGIISSEQVAALLVVPEVDRLPESVKTWYWRIDSNNAYGVTTGDVWSFTRGELPSFDSQSGSETIYVDVVPTPLTVVVSGNPTPTLQWYADGSPLPGEISDTYAPSAQSTSMAISYMCRATNSFGYTDSTPMVVTWIPSDPTRYNLLNMQSDLNRS